MRHGLSAVLALFACVSWGHAQNPQPLNPVFPGQAPGFGNQVFNGQQGQQGQGGGQDYDFDALMDLITSTVASETWAENGGGEAEIRPFVGGVYADAHGTLRRATTQTSLSSDERGALTQDLQRLRTASRDDLSRSRHSEDARQASTLRCVSLVRLEKEVARRIAHKEPLEEAMLTLAGLQRIEYVFLYPEEADIAIAGPAGDWRVSDERRLVAKETGQPVVRLDDLLTLLRRDSRSPFGCSIDPRAEGLAKAQEYLASHSIPASKRGRDRWLKEVRECVGLQDLTYQGVTGDSRVACVLGEADYHMKLIGMGLADGAAGMESYLDSIKVRAGEAAPVMGAVRWWFGMHYTAIESTESGDAYQIVGAGVRVQSESEALAERGQRVRTGRSDEQAQAYAAAFTQAFPALCEKYPVYAELRNVFDLSLVAALLQTGDVMEQARWKPTLLADPQRLPLPRYKAPTTVETVANLREVNRRQVIAGVSGGVWAQPVEVLERCARPSTEYSRLSNHQGKLPEGVEGWWWDVE